MKVLLDTHAWLWFVPGDMSLSAAAPSAIEDATNEKWVSSASYWEIAIKISIGKYTLPRPYEEFVRHAIDDQGFRILPVLTKHTALVCVLPMHHRDPFDRLLVAQALSEDISVISNDSMLDGYGVKPVS